MSEEIKVGQVWVRKDTPSIEVEIAFVGKDTVVFKYLDIEASCTSKSLLYYHTLKKPEPVLKKLVAFIPPDFAISSTSIMIEFENCPINWTKKELIVKDGSLYVDVGEG